MQLKQFLIVMIIFISPVLYGQNLSVPNFNLDEDFDANSLILRLPSPFSYHIIRDITELQLSSFTRNAVNADRDIQFLNKVEYSNIVRALEMRMGEMLHEGNNLIAILVNLYPRSFRNFLAKLSEDLESEEKKVMGLYLRDIEFHEYVPWFGESEWVIDFFAFGFIIDDGQTTNIKWPCNEECNQRFARYVDFNELHSQVLNKLGHDMFQSFEDILVREDIPKDHTLTLYLKDLSSEIKFVDNFTDVERINIGIIVEDNQGRFVRHIDWIIEKPNLQRTTFYIQESITTPLHESAHTLVKSVLLDDHRGYLSIEPTLYYANNRWRYTGGFLLRTSQTIEQDQWAQEGAILFAGKISEELLFETQSLETTSSIDLDIKRAIFAAFNFVCSTRDDIQNKTYCSLINDFNDFYEWLVYNDHILLFEDSIFMREVRESLSTNWSTAYNILVNNLEALIQLTRLALQKGSLESRDLQEFFQRYSTQEVSFEDSVTPKENRYVLPFEIGPDILDRNLSLLFSLDSQNNIDKVRQTSIQDILTEVETIEIPKHIWPFIRREPINEPIEQNYAEGLPSLYLRECVNIFIANLTS